MNLNTTGEVWFGSERRVVCGERRVVCGGRVVCGEQREGDGAIKSGRFAGGGANGPPTGGPAASGGQKQAGNAPGRAGSGSGGYVTWEQ